MLSEQGRVRRTSSKAFAPTELLCLGMVQRITQADVLHQAPQQSGEVGS